MFKNADDLKSFILWAESAGLKHCKLDSIEFTFSDYQMAKRVMQDKALLSSAVKATPTAPSQTGEPSPEMTEQEDKLDESLLFHSAP